MQRRNSIVFSSAISPIREKSDARTLMQVPRHAETVIANYDFETLKIEFGIAPRGTPRGATFIDPSLDRCSRPVKPSRDVGHRHIGGGHTLHDPFTERLHCFGGSICIA